MQPLPALVTRLTVDMILDVSGREHAGDVGGGCIALAAAAGHDIAVYHLDLPAKIAVLG